MNPCTLLMSFRCIKAFMHAFSGRFSRTCLEGISFNFFVCFIFNVSLGSAPKRKNFDIQRNTRVASGGQFTLNYHTPSHIRSTIMEKNNSFDQWILLILNHLWTVPTTRPPSLIKTMCSRRLKLQESRCIFCHLPSRYFP